MRQFFRELKRRNVYRVAVTYAVVAFVVVQAADLIFPALNIPPWAYSLVVVLTLLGFPIALVLAWAFEMTAEGVRRTPEGEPVEGEAAEEAPALSAGDRRESRLAFQALVGLGLLGAAVAGGWYLLGGGGSSPEVAERTVAVLPFEVSGSGADTWRDGMVTLLSTGLDGAGGLRAIADRTVFAAWRRDGRPGEGASTEDALAVARRIGARYAVVGSAVQLGGRLQFTAGVHEARSGDRLARVEVRGSPDSVTALSDSLAREVLRVLLEASDEELPSVNLASVTTESLAALKSFLAGERHLRAAEYEAAIEDYEAAVEADSMFAQAYLGLGRAQGWSLQYDAQARSWERAYELSDRLPERERGITRASHLRARGRMVAAVDTLRPLTEAYPDDPIVWSTFGETLWHGNVPRGWPEADRAFERSIELDPGHALYYPHHAQLGISVHDDSALAAERIASLPHEEWRETFRIPFDLAFGTRETRQRALARLDTVPLSSFEGLGPRHALESPVHGGAYLQFLEKLREAPDRPLLAPLLIAHARLGQGQVGKAVAELEEIPPQWIVGCVLAREMSVGIPVPDSLARLYLDPSVLPDDTSPFHVRCAGFYLVAQGRGEELGPLIERLRGMAEAEDEARAWVDELEGYRAWKAGDLERAARLWEGFNEHGRWGALWRGDLHRELGDLEEAEGWYLAAWPHPVAHERLGRLYEEMGQPEEAAAAYRRFVVGWQNADEELQDRVERARERLRALTAAGAGAEANTDG